MRSRCFPRGITRRFCGRCWERCSHRPGAWARSTDTGRAHMTNRKPACRGRLVAHRAFCFGNACARALAVEINHARCRRYGPRLEVGRLSFALRDAAARGQLYAAGTEALAELRAAAGYFSEFGTSIGQVLAPTEHEQFVHRLNGFAYQMRRTQSYLSVHDWRRAQYHLHASWRNLKGMRAILEAAASIQATDFVCGYGV